MFSSLSSKQLDIPMIVHLKHKGVPHYIPEFSEAQTPAKRICEEMNVEAVKEKKDVSYEGPGEARPDVLKTLKSITLTLCLTPL